MLFPENPSLLKGACESPDSNVRKENLIKLTEREPSGEWYLRLLDEYKNDYVFDDFESAEIEDLLNRDVGKIKDDEYKKVCESLGRMYLFYYKDLDENDNHINKDLNVEKENYLRATYWFDKASVDEGDTDVYARIGHF